MVEQYKQMQVEEFVKKLLSDERDFRKICLPDRTDLQRYIPELNEYLRKQNLSENRINLSESKLYGIIAPEIYIPFSNMSRANMSGANMTRACMSEANMSGTNMSGADMSGTNMSGACMSEANMSGADMSGAYMSGACMSGANMIKVIGLENVLGLDTAIFYRTIVTEKEREIILKKIEKFIVFDLREE